MYLRISTQTEIEAVLLAVSDQQLQVILGTLIMWVWSSGLRVCLQTARPSQFFSFKLPSESRHISPPWFLPTSKAR